MDMLAFLVLAAFAIAGAVVVVSHRSPVVGAVALAFVLVAIAGLYMVLGAQFVAILQVLVYAGAIMVLILFVIMLLNLQAETRMAASQGWIQRIAAPVLAVFFAAVVGGALFVAGREPLTAELEGFGTVASVGTELFTRFFYPFEVISLLLVVAMVGAVLLAKRSL
jgi:NADH-quinone oxidoreductase subunit J